MQALVMLSFYSFTAATLAYALAAICYVAYAVGRSIELIKGEEATPTQVLGDVFLTGRGRGIAPKTLGQKRYVDAIRSCVERVGPWSHPTRRFVETGDRVSA